MKSKQGKGCAYCNCQKPLTDDDFNGMRVDYVEGRPVIHGYVREKKFEALNHVICNLTEIQIKFLKTTRCQLWERLYPISGSVTKCTERDFIWWMWQ